MSSRPIWSIYDEPVKQSDPQFKFRLPTDLKEKLDHSAEASNRTVGAEIVARLESSFKGSGESADLALRVEERINETRLEAARSREQVARMHVELLAQRLDAAKAARRPKAEVEALKDKLREAEAEVAQLQARMSELLEENRAILARRDALVRPVLRQVDAVAQAKLQDELEAAGRAEHERLAAIRDLNPTVKEVNAMTAREAAREHERLSRLTAPFVEASKRTKSPPKKRAR